ncbi:electron transport complex protein RnfE [Acetitomaculum ruminis DSM 5522]|uniref:Ion-translocating oxidoreductase complex subunit E n=1 Tax=Acetitomaculum ruminis DSM 5522 TaxID=1120918 RepID=A0A1I1A4Q8_9FIRM|nr:electron transport complex subunit E [Acetitomaculum ruminis]SFB32949.1 electron transport complex protein RnfE [Acetitomaculum ruminis DSM 5522]
MKPNTPGERLINGLVKENPIFILMLGMCPTLAVTTAAMNGIGMGLSTTVVLTLSNLVISLLRKVIPNGVRMPAFIVVVASFVTLVQFLLQAYVPSIYEALGIYIPLIVVNCIILGRAESYASKNGIIPSIFDGIGMGLGFTVGLVAIAIVREILGSGCVFGIQILPDSYVPLAIFILAPGAFFVVALLAAVQNKLQLPCATNVEGGGPNIACGGNCERCFDSDCADNHAKVLEYRKMIEKQAEEEKKAKAAVKAAAKAKEDDAGKKVD